MAVRSAEPLPPLRLKVLGPPQVLLGDTQITFRRTKALALLAYLAVSRHVHTRDALAALLTDAAAAEVAKTRFRAVLADLHREVGAYLLVDRQTVALVPDWPIWLDLAELEAAVGDDATPAAPARLAEAVALYQGDVLAGIMITHAPAFEAWLVAQRERAQTLLVRALAHLSAAAERVGDAPTAMRWARRLLDQVPWEEAAHRRLMRLLARAGEREAALAQYVTCRRVLATELGCAPQPETIALVEELRAGPAAPPSNLPVPSPGFIGREAELALLAEWLADPACRLFTVWGLGGCGKSSLALQAAARQARSAMLPREQRFADGVYLVDLAGVIAPLDQAHVAATAARRIAVAIGRALGLELRGADPLVPLADWLGTRAVLLLLDNMEHLRAGAAVLSLLLERCPRLTLLVTSREALGVPEEWVLALHGLALPAASGEVEQAEAGRLFVQQLRQSGRWAAPAAADLDEIVRICQVTRGLPLALILAARWAPVLSLAAIARELATGLELLAPAGGLLLPERQRSLRVVLQATWARLSVAERRALRRLAVFQPGFTREAAQAVAGVEPATLSMLSEGALVERDPASGRYRVHELVRHYAAEQLARHRAEERDKRAVHAAYYAALVQQVTPGLHQTRTAQEAIAADLANIQLAWDWAVERAEAGLLEQILAGVARWYEMQGLPGQAVEALERAATRLRAALAQAATPDSAVQRLLGFVLVQQAYDLNWLASYERARLLLEEALDLARLTASLELEGRVAFGLGWPLGRQGDLRGTTSWMKRALALARAVRQPDLEADSLMRLGIVAMHAGEYAPAHGHFERALALYRAQDDRYHEMTVAYLLGRMGRERGDFGEAQRILEDALRLIHAMGWQHLADYCVLHELGLLHDEGWGRHMVAEDYLTRDLRRTQETGDRTREGFALAALGRNALYQGDLDRAAALCDRAFSLSREGSSRHSAAMALRGQSLLAHYLGDDRHARRCAEHALEIAQTTGMRREERLALRLLGHALLGLDELPAALVAYQQAADLDETLGFTHLRVETATDLARVALARGDTAQAVERVAAILPDLERGSLAGLEEPALAYLTCYRVLRAAGDGRADEVLAAGHAFLEERAVQFVDEEQRSRFLSNLPAHRKLLAPGHGGDEWRAGAGEPPAGSGAAPRPRIVRAASG
jgi:DNA-binding SARP family transcriptional activator/predicted ATPase